MLLLAELLLTLRGGGGGGDEYMFRVRVCGARTVGVFGPNSLDKGGSFLTNVPLTWVGFGEIRKYS